MKILYYNWTQFDKENNPGGGVNVYQKNLIDYLINNTENEIYFLSSGTNYDIFKRGIYIKKTKNIYGEKCKSFKIFNSNCVAPAKAMYNNIETFTNDEEIYKVFVEFIRQNGNFDVIHFNNIEGLSTRCLEIKKEFPNTKVIFSIHNYCLFCPQINLFYNNEKNCVNYDEGIKCSLCIKNKEKQSNFVIYYKLDKLLETFHLYKFSNNIKIFAKKIISKRKKNTPDMRENVDEKFSEKCVDYRKKNILRLNNYVDVILAVSERVRKISINMGIDENKIFTEYIGTKFAENALGHLHERKSPDIFTIAYMGYFEKMKGFDFLINSLEKLDYDIARKINFVCYARVKSNEDEEKVRRVEDLNTKLKSAKHFNGYNHNQLNQILNKIDLGIVPVIWEDNLPQIAIEYIAHGVPVLCSDLGGTQELSKTEDFIFKAEDENDFITKLTKIVKNNSLLNKYFENTIKLISMREHIDRLINYYYNERK